MMTETTPTRTSEQKQTPFGMRLQAARESLGLESKDAAMQLRLNEKVILMMETDCYSSDLPVTFLRGYIRSYGKLLQIPDHEIRQAIEPIQPKPIQQPISSEELPVTSSHYFVQIFTYLILFTLIGLVGIWWYTHSTSTSTVTAEKQINVTIDTVKPGATLPLTVKTDAVTASVNLGAKNTEPPETAAPNNKASETNDATIAEADEQDINDRATNSDNAE